MSRAVTKKRVIPTHVAIIMDGNGRWAKARGLGRLKGHEEGAKSVRTVIRCGRDAGVKDLTLYAFSSENWVRPPAEIRGLMRILKQTLRDQEEELHANRVRLRVIGRMQDLPLDVQRELKRVMTVTRDYDDGHLILALSYGSREEIAEAVRQIARLVQKGELSPRAIKEDTISAHLYAPDVPDPDLMIRTSGEQRISNFLLWQLSYSELYITDTFWPDFRDQAFAEALEVFSRRQRRFGDVKERG